MSHRWFFLRVLDGLGVRAGCATIVEGVGDKAIGDDIGCGVVGVGAGYVITGVKF